MESTIHGRVDEQGAVVRVSVWGALAPGSKPGPFPTTALIDTGASRTAIDPMVAAWLGLRPRDTILAIAPGAQGQVIGEAPLYDVQIGFDGLPDRLQVEAVGAKPATSGVLVLVGRDILNECGFVYNIPPKRFSLTLGTAPEPARP